MELLFLLVWNMRHLIEFQKARAQLQALLCQQGAESKEILDAFNVLKEAFFPFDKNARADELRRLRQALDREVSRGALSVTPMVDTYRPKIMSKLRRGDERLRERMSYRHTRGDAFDDAHRRARAR